MQYTAMEAMNKVGVSTIASGRVTPPLPMPQVL